MKRLRFMEGRGETGKYIYPLIYISSCQTDYVYFFLVHTIFFNRQQSTVTQTWTKLYKAREGSGPNSN